jgi:OOP family OmpA-OmpF porin
MVARETVAFTYHQQELSMFSRSFVIVVITGMSLGHARAAEEPAAYLVSADGLAVTTASGVCVRTGQWTPDSSYQDCEQLPFRIAMDALFDFDSAVLTLDAQRALDALAQQLAAAEYQQVEIVGRADRIGRPSYNQQLSKQRAGAVRDFLVARGMDGGKIAVSGVGSAAPVTGGLCENFHGEALVNCLQPDRAAEVTVTGMQQAAMR